MSGREDIRNDVEEAVEANKQPPTLFTGETKLAEVPHDPDYVYHGTSRDRLFYIADAGRLRTFKPDHGTDQDAWPDGSTQSRSYWSKTPTGVEPFIPDFPAAIVRGKQAVVAPKAERRTRDLYASKPVPSKHLDYWDGGSWQPMDNLKE